MPIYEIAGKRVEVREGISRIGAISRAQQAGVISLEEMVSELGVEMARPEVSGPLQEFLIGAGQSFADRSFGYLPNDIEPPDTLAAGIGSAAPVVAASFAVPGTVLAQAGLGAGLEAVREGSDPTSILLGGAAAGGGAALGSMASRVASGIKRIGMGIARRQPITTTTTSGIGRQFAKTVRGAGGFRGIEDFNQRLINKAAAKAILQNADTITPDVLDAGAKAIGELYEQAIPNTLRVDMSKVAQVVDDIPAGVLPRRAKLLANLLAGTGRAAKDADALLKDLSASMRGSQAGQWADELDDARSLLTEALRESGADDQLLREANKRWNVLKSLEEIGQTVKTGDVPAGQLVDKMRRSSRKGLSGFARGKATGVDEVDDLVGVARILAGDPVPVGSETFSRAAVFGPATLAAAGVASGQLSPEQGLAMAASGLAFTAAGPAAFGQAAGGAVQAAGGLANAVVDRARRERDE